MEFKNQWDQDEEKEAAKTGQHAVDLEKETIATDNTPIETTQESELTELTTKTESVPVESEVPRANPLASIYPAGSGIQSFTAATQDTAHKARRFLIAYMTTVFSAIVILYGTAWLGYVLIDHFIAAKKESTSWFYFDLAPLYISIMATLTIFGGIYIVASRYVTKSASDDSIGLKDWRAYKVVYAIFTALLIATAASVIAGLLYIPLAQVLIADDLESKRILITTLASLHVLLWIGILVWQERLVKKAKQSWLQGFVVVAGVAIVVIATGIFPVGSKTNERYDHRIETDLSALELKIATYQSDHKGELPTDLSVLKFDEDDTIKGRINDYKYTVKEAEKGTKESASSQQKAQVNATVMKLSDGASSSSSQTNGTDDNSSSSSTDDEAYYDALYEAMYSQKSGALTAKSYQLCATFRTDSTSKESMPGSNILTTFGGSDVNGGDFSKHKTGEVCFTRS